MSCDNRANKDKFHYGSQVQGDQVRICAEWWLDLPKTKPVINPKPLPKPLVDPYSFVVTPARARISTTTDLPLSIGQLIDLEASAIIHDRVGVLLGKSAVVRFTPVSVTWSFGDGHRLRATAPVHSYATAGAYVVSAVVAYAVKFRFKGTTRWLSDPRTISLETNRLKIPVVLSVPHEVATAPRLVYFDCQNFQYLGC